MNILSKCDELFDIDFMQNAGLYSFYRKCQGFDGADMVYEGRNIIMTASNNYLGLSRDPRVMEASMEAIRKYGTSCTGSRLLNGNLDLHEELEGELADFLGKEAAIVLSTGFLANQAAIESIAGPKDTILSDAENHASIISGCSLSKAKVLRYQHNDMLDLNSKVEALQPTDTPLIISDGVFSMGGDILDLPGLLKSAQFPGQGKIPVIIDDAHGLGVIGKGGRGTGSHFKLNDEVDLIVGTFSKSLASVGGFIAGDANIIRFIKHKARSLIFTAGLPAGSTAAALAALRILKAEPERVERLQMIARKVRAAFREMGLNTMNSQTPIIPVYIGQEGLACSIAKELYERGVFATPVVFPGVDYGHAILRTSFMSTHSDEQIDTVINLFGEISRRHGLDKLQGNPDLNPARALHARRQRSYSFKGLDMKKLALSGAKTLAKKHIIKLAHKI